MNIKMNLLENSMDYIINALELYKIADEYGTHRRERSELKNKVKWKLAFVSLVQAFELLLKYGLECISPILVYDDIDARNISTERTVNFSSAINRLTNFQKNPFSIKEEEFIKKCFRYRNNFIHCTVNIHTEDLKNKFAELYILYCKGYKFFEGNEFILESEKMNDIHKELHVFRDSFGIFRGEEIFKKDLEKYRQELKMFANKSYFITSAGDRVARIAFGKESNYLALEYHLKNLEYDDVYCDDCGVKKGEYHLPNCDMEICPVCKQQKLSCDCDLFLEGYDEWIEENE